MSGNKKTEKQAGGPMMLTNKLLSDTPVELLLQDYRRLDGREDGHINTNKNSAERCVAPSSL